MFIRKIKVKGKYYYQIVETVNGKHKILIHIGTIEKLYRTLVTLKRKGIFQ